MTISYYPVDCNGYWPAARTWQSVFDKLHARFPQALLGFGESGTSDTSLDTDSRLALWAHCRAVQIAGHDYVGLGLWWTWAEDAVPSTKPFFQGFAAGF